MPSSLPLGAGEGLIPQGTGTPRLVENEISPIPRAAHSFTGRLNPPGCTTVKATASAYPWAVPSPTVSKGCQLACSSKATGYIKEFLH